MFLFQTLSPKFLATCQKKIFNFTSSLLEAKQRSPHWSWGFREPNKSHPLPYSCSDPIKRHEDLTELKMSPFFFNWWSLGWRRWLQVCGLVNDVPLNWSQVASARLSWKTRHLARWGAAPLRLTDWTSGDCPLSPGNSQREREASRWGSHVQLFLPEWSLSFSSSEVERAQDIYPMQTCPPGNKSSGE